MAYKFKDKMVKLIAIVVVSLQVAIACDVGRFGQDCYFHCHCEDDQPCDEETGACPGACAGGWFGPGCQIGNVARGKTARLSTLLAGNPNNTVDGRNHTVIPSLESLHDCAGTNYKRRRARPVTWWQVDLHSEHVIYKVAVSQFQILRSSTYSSTYSSSPAESLVIIRVSNASIENRIEPVKERSTRLRNGTEVNIVDETICNKFRFSSSEEHGDYTTYSCRKPLKGRYVTIEIKSQSGSYKERFHLCEVDVIGYESCPLLEDGRGPGCLNDCRCENRSECGQYAGLCESGCRAPYYGETCLEKWPTPRLEIHAVAHEGGNDIVSFSANVQRTNSRIRDSLAWAILRFDMQWRADNESVWEGYPYLIFDTNDTRPVHANRSAEFRLQVQKLPYRVRYEIAPVMTVSNIVTKCKRPGPVRDIRASTGPTAVILTWEGPTEKSAGFQLEYGRIFDKSCNRSTVGLTRTARANSSTYVLKHLHPYSTYHVKIQPTVEGSFGTVAETTFETLSASPELDVRPETPEYRHLTSRSVELTYIGLPCEYANGPFKSYSFRIIEDLTSEGSRPEDRIIKVSNASQRLVFVNDLKPRVNYSVSYTYDNDVESSLPSTELRFLTESELPKPPMMSLWDVLPNGTVKLWAQPSVPPRARLVEIVVECRMGDSDKIVTERRNIERQVLPARIRFYSFVAARGEITVCKARVHSDEGPSPWSQLYSI